MPEQEKARKRQLALHKIGGIYNGKNNPDPFTHFKHCLNGRTNFKGSQRSNDHSRDKKKLTQKSYAPNINANHRLLTSQWKNYYWNNKYIKNAKNNYLVKY